MHNQCFGCYLGVGRIKFSSFPQRLPPHVALPLQTVNLLTKADDLYATFPILFCQLIMAPLDLLN
eukprot:3545548-Rhodomonas_salina.2